MTTEIAVLNRLGVALAADSAVTISGGGTSKVFQSADKLFELSCVHPVAIMLNGNMDCFGVPWEIIIKDFRISTHADAHKHVHDWAEAFIVYVESRTDVGNDSARSYVSEIAASEIDYISDKATNRFFDIYDGRFSNVDFNALIDHVIKERSLELSTKNLAESLKSISDADILDEYGQDFGGLVDERLSPMLRGYAPKQDIFEIILKSIRSIDANSYSTGLIVAGYGPDDNYPSVFSIDVDGYVSGRLKYSNIDKRAKIDKPEFGYAVSFAQTDVIERLLGGADPQFITKTAEFISRVSDELADVLMENYPKRISKKKLKEEREKIRRVLGEIEDRYTGEAAEKFKLEFREEFEKMIALMPKLELIELAEALISITAIERKATSDEGTVGGPIDVAFITKHEGFVWIKRKYYFNKDLNPRYFWRKYELKSEQKSVE